MSERAKHEIQHGEFLAGRDTELIWGWGTPAGRIRAKRRAKLIEIGARLGPDSSVLEIGCGTGMFTEMFAQTGCSIIAVDISAALLKKAEARKLPKKKVNFMQKRFEDCNVDSPFDAVIGSSILHHLELNDALSRIYELLKPNGIMSFAEPNMLNPQVFAERKLRWMFPYISPDETAFVRWALRSNLEKTGFQDIKIVPFDWLHPSVPKQLVGMVSAIGRVIERVPLLREFSGSLHIKAVRPSD
jgi:2-polyprenyl-3-methyl-5-hydroxy-6-metoxy-1,4-benzoquinol methylase